MKVSQVDGPPPQGAATKEAAGEAVSQPGPEPFDSGISLLSADTEIIAAPRLVQGIGELCEEVAKSLRENKLDELRVAAFSGPRHFEGGSTGLKRAFLEGLALEGARLSPTSTATLKGQYFPLYDEGTRLLTLAIQTSLWQGDAKLTELPLLSIDDRGLLAQVLGLARPDFGSALSAEQETMLVKGALEHPSVVVAGTRIRSSPTSPYALEIQIAPGRGTTYAPRPADVRDGQAYLPTPTQDELFRINLINESEYDAAVEVTLDGLNLFAFYEHPGVRHVVVPKHQAKDIKGWPRWPTGAGRIGRSDLFVFTEYTGSAVAELKADRSKVGLITASFAAAWETFETAPRDDRVETRDIAIGRGGTVETPSGEVQMHRGRIRAEIPVRYRYPE